MPVPPRGFGRDARLSERRDFQSVIKQGRKTPGRGFVVWSRLSDSGASARLGLSVGAKVGTAVRRARLKRLTRETFRLNRAKLRPGCDLVVGLRPGLGWENRAEAERDLLDAWLRAGLLRE